MCVDIVQHKHCVRLATHDAQNVEDKTTMSNKKKQNETKKNCIYENSTTNGKVQLWAGNGENIILVAMPTEQIDKLSSVCVCVRIEWEYMPRFSEIVEI